jgi:tetratricopeptide (TPR) repeat protein
MALVRRRLVHPEQATAGGEDGFRFHHALIRDSVYAGIDDTARARSHEVVARVIDARSGDVDELVGYHLEQASRVDPTLIDEAGRRLGAAGERAMRRIDAHTAVDLLTRATALVPDPELRWALGTALKFRGDVAPATELLEEVVRESSERGDARLELLARVELVWPMLASGAITVDEALALTQRACALFEERSEAFGLGRALHLECAVRSVYTFHYGVLEEIVPRIVGLYERTGGDPASVTGLSAVSAYRGPRPVPEAIKRCHALLIEAATPVWASFVLPPLAALEAMRGEFERARRILEEARLARKEFSDNGTLMTSWSAIAAEVELLAGDAERAEAILAESCAALREARDREWLATNTAMLADAVTRQGRFTEGLAVCEEALAVAPRGHLTSRSVAGRVHALALAHEGRLEEATRVSTETIALLRDADVLDEQGAAFAAAADVHELARATAEAEKLRRQAVATFTRKGNVVAAARAEEAGSP